MKQKMMWKIILCVLFQIVNVIVVDSTTNKNNDCPKPNVLKKTIIRSETSISNGAQLLKKLEVESARTCYSSCCDTTKCNVAVMHYKQEYDPVVGDDVMKKYCFLFDCGNPSVCSYESHNRYAIIEVPKLNSNLDSTTLSPTTEKKNREKTTSAITTTTAIGGDSTTSSAKKLQTPEKCPEGAPVAMCSDNPCKNKGCALHKNAICRPSFCGGCFAKFYDVKGNILECEKRLGLSNNLEDIQVAKVDYGETPIDSLPVPTKKKEKSNNEDPYFQSNRREWVDGRKSGNLINATVTETPTQKPFIKGTNSTKIVVVNNTWMSVPLLIALIISIVLIIGLIYRFTCSKRGKPKKLPVDDGDYLINGMYL